MSAIMTPPAMPASTPPPAAGPQPWKWSVADYYKLGDLGFFQGKRVELIRGEIIERSPINWPHSLATGLVGDALRVAFAGIAWVTEQGPHPTDDSDPEPDVRVIRGARRDYTDHPREALLVVEVADAT